MRIYTMTVASLLLLLIVALSLAMALAWMIARRPGRSGWTDAIWSLAIGAAGVAAAIVPLASNPATSKRQWIVAALVAIWSLRLGLHIARRAAQGQDDPRYTELRRDWGDGFDRRLFWFLQIQAAAAAVLIASILVAARNPAPSLAWSDWAGGLILLVAIAGEAVADRQLAAFARANKDGRGDKRVADTGLWGWSRHPNYFFEWLGWAAYPVIAIGPAAGWPWGWVALSGSMFMYWLLVHVSGIPPLEAHMRRSRGKAFSDYQVRVSAFWPMPPRS